MNKKQLLLSAFVLIAATRIDASEDGDHGRPAISPISLREENEREGGSLHSQVNTPRFADDSSRVPAAKPGMLKQAWNSAKDGIVWGGCSYLAYNALAQHLGGGVQTVVSGTTRVLSKGIEKTTGRTPNWWDGPHGDTGVQGVIHTWGPRVIFGYMAAKLGYSGLQLWNRSETKSLPVEMLAAEMSEEEFEKRAGDWAHKYKIAQDSDEDPIVRSSDLKPADGHQVVTADDVAAWGFVHQNAMEQGFAALTGDRDDALVRRRDIPTVLGQLNVVMEGKGEESAVVRVGSLKRSLAQFVSKQGLPEIFVERRVLTTDHFQDRESGKSVTWK